MFIETFPVGQLGCNCSIIADPNTGEAIIVDPGDEAPLIIERVRAHGFSVRYLLHTHAHIDHVGATADVKDALGAEICLHKDDLFLYDNLEMQSQFLRIPTPKAYAIDQYLTDTDTLEAGALTIETIHTPGHTPGSLCFLWQRKDQSILFSGDTLFRGSIGRTDLWGGDYPQIIHSIETQLLTRDENILVIPGHGPETTLAHEARHNPFLKH